jgi:RNA polymerase sigma-70 factor (ECF subfamily)
VLRDSTGALINVFSFEIADGAVQTVRSVISREKLRHLGPLADLPGLRSILRRARSSE